MDVNDRKARATEEAAEWWRRLGTLPPESIDEKDRQEFTQWLRESPLHVAELLHISHVHDALGRFKLWDDIPLEASASDDCLDAPSQKVIDRLPRRGWVMAAVAITAAVAVIGVLANWHRADVLETDRAERREMVLRDGSVVNLEPQTTVRVELEPHRRYLTLTRGRAIFHVAKDPARPFIVHAGDTDVRAVGTVFGIDHTSANTVVTVSEGKVAVATTPEEPSAANVEPVQPSPVTARAVGGTHTAKEPGYAMASGAPGEVFLVADQQLTVRKAGTVSAVQNVDAARALAWSRGQLVFDSVPLKEVVQEFNRYNRVQLRLEGGDLAHRTISGVFKATDPQTLIDFIGAGAHVVIRHQDAEDIVISASTPTSY